MSLKVEIEDLEDFNEYNDATFDLEYCLETSKEIVNSRAAKEKSHFTFDDNYWRFLKPSQNYAHFDFTNTTNIIKFYMHIVDNEFIQIVKCWIGMNLVKFETEKIRHSYSHLIEFLKLSQCFLNDKNRIDNIEEELKGFDKSKRYWHCIYILNFIQFYEEIDPDGLYSQMLRNIKDTVSYKDLDTVRILPSTKDLLFFHTIITDYFDTLDDKDPNYYRFFPIAFWWQLTTIIPIRPFEFCNIPRDGVFEKDNRYFVHVPRSDKKGGANKNNIQIVKDIPISKDIYDSLNTYKKNTEKFGVTQTLISYKAVKWASKEILKDNNGSVTKINDEYFSYGVLYNLLNNFYQEVVFDIYDLTFNPKRSRNLITKGRGNKKFQELLNKVKKTTDDRYIIQRKVNLGDTRHMALMNLQRLGYHPVEMARLAGHKSIHTQFSYHSHQQNWVDTEVLKLLTKFKMNESQNLTRNKGFIGAEIKDDFDISNKWRDKFLFNPEEFSENTFVRRKLELGYCTDKAQRCQVKDCAEGCDYWRISLQEYKEKKYIIEEKIKKSQSNLDYLVVSLLDLYKYAVTNSKDPSVSVDNFTFNQKLLNKSVQIDECIHRLAELMAIEERKLLHE